MSQENVETIRGFIRGVEERDLEACLAVGHPEFVIREPDSLPYGGEYRDLEGLRRHAAGWMRSWAALQPGNERKLDATFIDAGDHVVARWRLKARAPMVAKSVSGPADLEGQNANLVSVGGGWVEEPDSGRRDG